jgi:hypothetical protein
MYSLLLLLLRLQSSTATYVLLAFIIHSDRGALQATRLRDQQFEKQ